MEKDKTYLIVSGLLLFASMYDLFTDASLEAGVWMCCALLSRIIYSLENKA